GKGAGDFKVGDAVFGVCEVPREGSYAEKIAIRQEIVARKPEGLSHVQCTAIALAGLTALISLEETLKLKAGETILIQGGAGGVAGFAIALAKHLGARVITTASEANHAYVRSLGADEVIDYRTQDFTQLVSNCDAVFDTAGGDVTERSFSVLRPGGRLATVAAGAAAPVSPRSDVTSLRPKVNRDRPHLDRVGKLAAQKIVPLPPMVEYPLAEAAAAHRVSEARHLRGKLVLRVR
ncbi:MAG TPA: NADP-dependent oxidoreductase, partial [Burkholderiales bacterium]|nr:NADP-dependent oxidoreductase [Burkholderiales bacterium]